MARPRTSEHEAGLAVDIVAPDFTNLNPRPGRHPAASGSWPTPPVRFILRYPRKNKASPHRLRALVLRICRPRGAEQIYSSKLCLENSGYSPLPSPLTAISRIRPSSAQRSEEGRFARQGSGVDGLSVLQRRGPPLRSNPWFLACDYGFRLHKCCIKALHNYLSFTKNFAFFRLYVIITPVFRIPATRALSTESLRCKGANTGNTHENAKEADLMKNCMKRTNRSVTKEESGKNPDVQQPEESPPAREGPGRHARPPCRFLCPIGRLLCKHPKRCQMYLTSAWSPLIDGAADFCPSGRQRPDKPVVETTPGNGGPRS